MGDCSAGRRRVLFLSHYFPPECNAPAWRVFEVCRRWVRWGWDVTVVTCVPNSPQGRAYEDYRNRLWQWETVEGIRLLRLWTYLAANRGRVRRTLNYLSYMLSACLASGWLERPDVIVATSPHIFCGWAGAIVSLLKRRPLVLDIRDIWPESIGAVGAISSQAVLAALGVLERAMYVRAAHIVTVGEGYRQRLIARGVPAERISIVTNGVDAEIFHPQPGGEEIRSRYGLGAAFVCIYAGTIGMACGLEVVLAAAEMLRLQGRQDIRFLLVGDGAERHALQQRCRSLGLDNVTFAGRQDRRDVPRFLAAADAVLVHLKRREAFRTVLPSKIFEAASMAKPIILGVEGCAAELVRAAGAGLCITPEDPQGLLDAIETLAGDPPGRQAMGQAGHDYVTRHFDRSALARAYLDIVSRLAGEDSTD